jgi:hypothetical protein
MVYFIAVHISLHPEPSTSLTVAFKDSIQLPLFEHRRSFGDSVGMLHPGIIHFTTGEFIIREFVQSHQSNWWLVSPVYRTVTGSMVCKRAIQA